MRGAFSTKKQQPVSLSIHWLSLASSSTVAEKYRQLGIPEQPQQQQQLLHAS